MSALPPVSVVRAVEGLRANLQRLNRKLAPGAFSLLELAQGGMVSQALRAAAELRVAEALADGPLPVGEIAQRTGADPDALRRLLRMLASYSVFAQNSDGRYKLTPMADALRADAEMSMRDFAILMGHPLHCEDWAQLTESVRTGEASLPKQRGVEAFEYLEANPEYGAVFMNGMGNLSVTETEPILAACDFKKFGTVVDFCGGNGALLAGILRAAPDTRGVLYDPKAETSGAAALLEEEQVADRCTLVTGGLFDAPPGGGDAYVLKHIVHDWPREQALEILRNVRQAMGPGGRLLLMEMVLPSDGDRPHPAKLFDLWLLLLLGGRERTREEYAKLLGEAGFQLERVVPTVGAVSIVEAVPR